MRFNKFLAELRRRNVIRVATAYAIVSWLIIQVVVAIDEPLRLPDWFDTATIIFVAAGFPIALVVAWAFELTPEGIRKTAEVQPEESIAPETGSKLNRLIIASLVILIAFLLVERFFFAGEYGTEPDQELAALPASAEMTAERSVAVLPFVDFSPDKDQEWFADGLTEEILNSLVKTPDLKVAARTSSFKFKGSNEEIPTIAEALGVDHVLEGSIRRTPERLRVTAQLIRASDGFHVWSDTYDRTPDDAINIQEELALSIAKALNTAMDSSALADMIKIGTASVTAYNAYLEGLTDTGIESGEGRTRRISSLNKARTLDPSFAEAHYAAARFWAQEFAITQIGVEEVDKDFAEVENNFKTCIHEAIQTTTSSVDRLKYRVTEADVNLRWNEAERLYDEYFELRPNDFTMMESCVRMLIKLNKYEKANVLMARLEAGQGENLDTRNFLINFYHRLGNFAASDRLANIALEENPTNYDLMYQAQRALLWSGQTALARQAHDNYLNFMLPQNAIDSSLIFTVKMRQLCGEGKRAEAEALFAQYNRQEFSLTNRWHILNALGNKEEADELLRRFDNTAMVRQFTSYLWYPQFDPTLYPELMKVLERENVTPIPPKPIPFALTQAQSL